MKVFIVGGAGTVGSATAYHIALKGIADEVVIQDLNMNAAESHAMDMSQAVFPDSKTVIKAGTWEDAEGSDAVVIAAGMAPQKMMHDNCRDIANMMPLIESISEGLNKYCPHAVVLSLTNPLDVFNYVLYKESGLESKQFIAFAANDSIRFRWALGNYFNVHPSCVEAYSVGEHAADVIPLFSTVKIDGHKKEFTDEQKSEVEEYMKKWWMNFIRVSENRTASWTTGAYAAATIEHISGIKTGPICAGAITEDGLSIDGPVYLDRYGFVRTADIELTPEESERYENCKNNVKEKIKEVLEHIGLC